MKNNLLKTIVISGLFVALLISFAEAETKSEELNIDREQNVEVEEDVDTGEDYNSPRSNRSINEPNDDDSDGDGIEDREEDADSEVAGNGKVHAWGRGLSVAIENVEENEGSETALRNLKELQVNAEEIRGWNEEEKENLRQQLNQEENKNTPEGRVGRIAEMVMNNNRLGDINANEEETEIKYRARMKLFGFIPVEKEIEASMDKDQKVKMNYPWYSFLSTRPDEDEIINTLSEIVKLKGGIVEKN